VKIVVYGTLRRGGSLNGYLGADQKYIETKRIEGWDMFSLNAYPYIRRGEGSIVVDVFDVSEDNFDRTSQMERAAGYEVTEIADGAMFYAPEDESWMDGSHPLVENGDWSDYRLRAQQELRDWWDSKTNG